MSIGINTNPAGMTKSIDWEQILSSIGDVKKADSVDGKQTFTVTTTSGGETVTTTISIPDDLEIPENVGKESLQGLVDKLGVSGLNITEEQISAMKESISKAYDAMMSAVDGAESSSGTMSKKTNAMFNLYALMALMIDVAQSQRDAQREIRTAENQAIQKSYQNQADTQRDAANLGMWVGIGCGVFSAASSIGLMTAQGVTASQQAKIVDQAGGTSAQMRSTMLQNTDSPEHAATQLNNTIEKVGDGVANRVQQDFESKLSGDGNNGNLKTALDEMIVNNNEARNNVIEKEETLSTERETLTQKEGERDAAQRDFDEANSKATEKQAAYDKVVKEENTKGNLFGADAKNQDRIDAAKAELDSAKNELATARTRLDTANKAVEQQTQKVTTAQNDVTLANQKVASTETALTQARSDYQKTVSEVASSYRDKYQNAVDRLSNPSGDVDVAELKANVETAKSEMEMAFAVEADLLSQNGVMTPTEQTNLVSTARDKVDFARDSAYKRADVKAFDSRMTKLTGVAQINQSIGGVLQTMASQLSSIKSSEATREQAETTKEQEMLDQTKDLFDQAGDLIDQAIQLYSAVVQTESQSMRDAIQA